MNIPQLALKQLSEACLARDISIATAESVTAGFLQFLLSQMPNATQIFNGGITAYNVGQKVKHLGLDYTHGIRCNGVSYSTADIMARSVGKLFNSKIGIAITGYASPIPEDGINEIYAYLAIALNGENVHIYEVSSTATSAAEVQQDYALQVLDKLLDYVEQLAII